jgi:uncharacterized membrane protein YphA (DoxX/SURF4 family)
VLITTGMRVYALGAFGLGLIGLVWADFALVWQPVPAGLPARAFLACVFAAALSVGGLALNWPRTAARGAALLCALFALVVVLLHVPKAFAHPLVFASWNGVAEQLVLTCAGLLAYALIKGSAAPRGPLLCRLGQRAFGVCLIVFGLAHFFYLKFTAGMVPAWLPPAQTFWAAVTGIAHLLAGVAVLSGVRARLAAMLLTVMFAIFGLLVHAPLLFQDPHSHLNWVMNAQNLALTGAAWVLADSLRSAAW